MMKEKIFKLELNVWVGKIAHNGKSIAVRWGINELQPHDSTNVK